MVKKIGVMTDLHLGLRQYGLTEREQDFYDQYMKAIDIFIQNGLNIVLLGGDIFDQPRPSPKALRVFSEGMKKLFDHDISVFNVIGNHAMIQSPDFVTADEFLSTALNSNKYHLLNKDNISDEDVFIAGLPYYFNYELEDFIKDVNVLNDKAGKFDGPSILMLHQAFKEFCGFTGEDLSIKDINTQNFDLIVCGHIHEKKLIEINESTVFLQPGSLERLTVAEARDEEVNGKGVFIFDLNNISIESIANGFIHLKSDRKFYISDFYLNTIDDLVNVKNEILQGVNNCDKPPVLFLTVHDSSKSFHQIMDMTKDLKSDCLTVKFTYLDESIQESDLKLDSTKDIPPVKDVLRLALNPLDEDEAKLALDLFDLLKDGKDAKKLLDDFLEKKKQQHPSEHSSNGLNADIAELTEFFENLKI